MKYIFFLIVLFSFGAKAQINSYGNEGHKVFAKGRWYYYSTPTAFTTADSFRLVYFKQLRDSAAVLRTAIGGGVLLNATNTMGASGKFIFPALSTDATLRSGSINIQGISTGLSILSNNIFFNGSLWEYRATGTGQVLEIGSSYFLFKQYVSQTAGTTTATGFTIPLEVNTHGIAILSAATSIQYLNFGSNNQASGIGHRNNSGTMEVKNSGSDWAPIGAKYNTATDADFTVTSGMIVVNLPTISANRNITINSGVAGQRIIIINKNSAGFAWNISGTNVKDAADVTITAFVNDTAYTLVFDGTNWYVI